QALLAKADEKGAAGKKPEKGAARGELLQGLFGPNGVFADGDGEMAARLPAERKRQMEVMQGRLQRLKKEAPPAPPTAHGLAEASPADMKVYIRGNPAQQGEPAPRRFLRILAGENAPRFRKGSGRLELAEAVASPDNPLTARVIVNRIWQHHFGRGIVGTPSNFGKLGERPTHPELLDHLATRFIASGWSIKALHREILLSATYRMSCDHDEHNAAVDPGNRLLWRMNRQRLDVEAWRDALLAATGELDERLGG